MLKLNIGAGDYFPVAGYVPIDRKRGGEAFPLRSNFGVAYRDNEADVIRASHVLEHFPRAQLLDVIKEWVRVLKPGGVLRVAVPNFEEVAQRYLNGVDQPTAGYVVGGQDDADDFHKAIFDETELKQLMAQAGLVLLRHWTSEVADCASLPISLNLEGTKPFQPDIKVSAAMSVPRLGFMDNFFSAFRAMLPLDIKLRQCTGAFWGQSLTHCFEQILEEDKPDAILTLDYDSVFKPFAVAHLLQLMLCHPEAHAIAALQASRYLDTALFTAKDDEGRNRATIPIEELRGDLFPVDTAHFGLTLIRADKLRDLPRPWFRATPDANGRWELPGRIDEDIHFWNTWRQVGNSLFLAPRAVIGHAELMLRWPDKELKTIWQPMREWHTGGAPKEAWT